MAMHPACLNSPSELTTKQRKTLWSCVLHTTVSQYHVTLSEQWHGLCHIDHCSCYQHKNSKFYRNYYRKFVLCLQERWSQIYVGCWEQYLCASISCRQCDVEAVLVQPRSLFLESQYAIWYGLVNIVVCTALSSEWMTHSQLCQST